jgi:hypothetical protein
MTMTYLRPLRVILIVGLAVGLAGAARGQGVGPGSKAAGEAAAKEAAPPSAKDVIARAVEFILSAQESLDGKGPKAEWPYEGVYRVRREIPIGYRVGGTAICAVFLVRAPGYEGDAARKEAVARAVDFVCAQREHPLMSPGEYDAGYDVRGWGYTYALAMLLELKARDALPAGEGVKEKAEATIAWAIKALEATEIPRVGGWNYARPPGKAQPAPSSPFMTGPSIQALLEARRQGYAVDGGVLERGLKALERCRGETGAYSYAASSPPKEPEPVPGAVGRMLAGETTLLLAGRGDVGRVRAALDGFVAHWSWLEKRRARPGTHEGPYAIAPYYFYYAHYYAAQAVEMMPPRDRPEYRRRVAELVMSTRGEDGTWNDRVFPRSAAYGTAMSGMCLLMAQTGAPARVIVPAVEGGAPVIPDALPKP